jgi:sirohydrochlorin ferrochelatase/(2Fe-2S) ferredoxin
MHLVTRVGGFESLPARYHDPFDMNTAILIVGHGSRDETANAEFEALVDRYRNGHPERAIYRGYIELARPSLEEALRTTVSEHGEVVVLPLSLFRAGHVKNDIPLVLERTRKEFPSVAFRVAEALGVHPALARAAFERACEGQANLAVEASRTGLVVVGRGSSDPDANGDFYKSARLIGEGRRFPWVLPCFIGITPPYLDETLELAARARPERMLLLPYFLFAGTLLGRIREQAERFARSHPWIQASVAPHLENHPALLDLMDQRIEQARLGQALLPCDNCQYRVPMPGREDQVGGLKALLWSSRHLYTHGQAAPHAHAHKPMRKHVLVCGNVDCADRGSIPLIATLRRIIKDNEQERSIRVTRTSCMGRCGEGPTVAVYPDGIWYRGVRDQDAEELFREHLMNDRLVGRLVDNILQ